ncbi:alpha/beta hydrolase [Candidatus Thiothrix sp. Deng01]|uniref:Alpha/beta hydrolase n=1 Tax=Candidatus Thiothrix phosphatis TaxID=3112415 RepID=A0ABU6CS73_9GAMM|nr:alpha/beta hydrolase [Candidatus Thiothrix sp. Deng01]MEB4589634.1 alpha/beta hydrolase [Candidatus Thiothrix sp. Deng01]
MSNSINHEPMPPALVKWLDALNQGKKVRTHYHRTPTNVREGLDVLTRQHVTAVPEMPLVLDDLVPGAAYLVPVRIYHPQPTEALPVAVFVHGGGHVAGSASLYDPIARKLALAMRHVLVSVDYRLAPECPYPAALLDVMATVKGVYPLLDTHGLRHLPRLTLAGDSGGGALSATVAHLCQFEPSVSIERQLLIYPSLDYTLSSPSITSNGDGYLLERERILWLFDCYLQQAENRYAISPLFMPITPQYPKTLIVTAGYCPLHDEGIAYAERLTAGGIVCEHQDFAGMIHTFLNLEDLVPQECARLYQQVRDFCSQAA